mgnify:CR=1 FL=1
MEWIYATENDEQIPIAEADIKSLVDEGVIKRKTLMWNESMSDWTACEVVLPDLFPTNFVEPAAPIASGPPQTQPPGGGPPAFAVAPVRPRGPADGLATTSLVCGIVGVVGLFCASGFLLPVSIASVICGHVGRKKLREANLPLEHGQLTAGIILGWIGVGFSILCLIGILVYFLMMGAFIATEAGNSVL